MSTCDTNLGNKYFDLLEFQQITKQKALQSQN